MNATKRIRGSAWMATRERIKAAAQGLCVICRSKGKATLGTVCDHIKPIAHGGSNDDANLRWICDDCHNDVTRIQFGGKPKVTTGLDGWPVA
jgi:5-methylcytosine-specific restriction protein A